MEKNILLFIYLPTNLFIQFLVLYRCCCSPTVHVLYIGSTCMRLLPSYVWCVSWPVINFQILVSILLSSSNDQLIMMCIYWYS